MSPELSPSTNITHEVYVFEGKLSNYDKIIRRDLLNKLGIFICFSKQTIKWLSMDTECPMKTMSDDPLKSFFVQDSTSIQADTDRISKNSQC